MIHWDTPSLCFIKSHDHIVGIGGSLHDALQRAWKYSASHGLDDMPLSGLYHAATGISLDGSAIWEAWKQLGLRV